MFRCVVKHLFWWPVTVLMPNPDQSGTFIPQTFEMQFEALPQDRARQLDAAVEAMPVEERVDHLFDYLFEVCRGWRDVADENEVSVPFSREVFAEQLQFTWFRTAVANAYAQAMSGEAARLGN